MKYQALPAPPGLAPDLDPPEGWAEAGPFRAVGFGIQIDEETGAFSNAVLWERPLRRTRRSLSFLTDAAIPDLYAGVCEAEDSQGVSIIATDEERR